MAGSWQVWTVIKHFRCKETEHIYHERPSRKLPTQIQQQALRRLQMLDYAVSIEDLKIPPSNRLEALKGDRQGQYSIRINQQWRVCFTWEDGHAHNVEIVDYH